ncbi:MAG TPA: DnaJ domain-containing protein [Trichocoleus sp.]
MPMLQIFSPEWLSQLSDPYAVLGLSVAADDRRVLKRYRAIAKQLHPDSQVMADAENKELAVQIFSRLVNPAYQKVKQEKGRADVMATLRFRVRRINRDEPLRAYNDPAAQLLKMPVHQVELFYEQAITELAEKQFQSLDQFETLTQQLNELNLVYLHLKMGEPMIRERRTGVVAASEARPTQFTPSPSEETQTKIDYAQRHYQRAQEYARKGNWAQVVAELRDAIRLEATRSEYHSLLAKAYLAQNLMGMAKVHFRQALKLNPQDPLARIYAPKFQLNPDAPDHTLSDRSTGQPAKPPSRLLNLFGRKR